MKKILFPLLAWLAGSSLAMAQNALSVSDVVLPQNGEAALTVNYQFDKADTYTGYSFHLDLPADVAFVMQEGTDVAYVKGSCHASSHSVTANLSEGLVKVAGLSLSSTPLSGTEGMLLQFTVRPTAVLPVGTVVTGSIKDIIIVPVEGEKQRLADQTFTVTIGEAADSRVVIDENAVVAPEDAAGVDVRVRRTIFADEWSTICLPFSMTAAQVAAAFGDGVELADFVGCESETDADDRIVGITVKFADATSIEANHPYIIKVREALSEFTADGVDITVDDEPSVDCDRIGKGTKKDPYLYNSFVGTYVAQTTVPALALFLSEGGFWYSAGLTRMKALRAYFDFYDVLADIEERSGSAVRMVFVGDDEPTGISGARQQTEDEAVYDLQGRRVSKPGKGIYIYKNRIITK